MAVAKCVHEEVLDYVDGRYLGYCRKCGRTMQYDPTGGENPRDVTAEFDGNCPFPSPFEGRRSVPITPQAHDNSGDEPLQDSALEKETPRAGTGGGRNNRERGRYYLAHKDEILADVRELGPTKARKKWNIPSSTFNHHMQRWGVWASHVPSEETNRPSKYEADREAMSRDIIAMRPAEVCRKWGIPKGSYNGLLSRWGLREQRDGEARRTATPGAALSTATIQVPAGMADKRSNAAKGRYWKAHLDEIAEDLRATGPDATRAKWGMGEAWFYHQHLLGPSAHKDEPAPAPPADAAESSFAVGSVTQTGGNGCHLPPWSDSWDPAVQVEWLRAYRAETVARLV